MRTHALIFASALVFAFAAQASIPLPPGMARADDPQQVAALDERPEPQPTASRDQNNESGESADREAYQQQRIAYLAQLQQQQRERKRLQAQLEREREAREQAEARAAELERERRREEIYILHHSLHAYQRRLNEQYWREQRLRRLLCEERAKRPCAEETLP